MKKDNKLIRLKEIFNFEVSKFTENNFLHGIDSFETSASFLSSGTKKKKSSKYEIWKVMPKIIFSNRNSFLNIIKTCQGLRL